MKNRYVLKNKTRFSIFVILTIIVLLSLVYTSTAYGFKQTTYKQIEVKSGDTLWDIAKRYNTNGDIREHVYAIKKANSLKGSEIYQGSLLKIPVE